MTVYPLVFNIGPLEVTGFGIMMMLGFFTAGWVMQKALIDKSLNDAYAEYIIIAGVVGGILGAKLLEFGHAVLAFAVDDDDALECLDFICEVLDLFIDVRP